MLFANMALAQYKLETGLPGISELPKGTELPSYIRYLFIFGLSLIAFLALGQMMLGGLTYILAAGNVAKVETAKDTIKQALLGLGLLLVSYLLLRTINPDLVNLRNPNLIPIAFKDKVPVGTFGVAGTMWSNWPCKELGSEYRAVNKINCSTNIPHDQDANCCQKPTTDFNWKEPPLCPEGWNPTSDDYCSGSIKPSNYICCGRKIEMGSWYSGSCTGLGGEWVLDESRNHCPGEKPSNYNCCVKVSSR